jgi:hypothetical protein
MTTSANTFPDYPFQVSRAAMRRLTLLKHKLAAATPDGKCSINRAWRYLSHALVNDSFPAFDCSGQDLTQTLYVGIPPSVYSELFRMCKTLDIPFALAGELCASYVLKRDRMSAAA